MSLHHHENEFLAKYADRLKPVLVAVVDSKLNDPSTSYVVHSQVNTEFLPLRDHTHDEGVARSVAKWVDDKSLLPIVASWITASGQGAAVRAAVDAGVVSYAIPYDVSSAWRLGLYGPNDSLKYAHEHDVVAVGPMHDGTNWPANGANMYDSILSVKSCTNDGIPRGKYAEGIRTIHVLAEHSSNSTGVAAGAAALLRMVAPNATAGEVVDAIFTGADVVNGNAWLNMLNAADILVGDSVAQPEIIETIPTPEPETPMYTETVETPFGQFATEQKFNVNGRWGAEGLAQGFDGLTATKALVFSPQAEIDYVSSMNGRLALGLSIITGNDSPERDPSGVVITFHDGSQATAQFEKTADRLAEIKALVAYDPALVGSFTLTNHSGPILQFADMKLLLKELAPAPDPEPTPDPEPIFEPTPEPPAEEPAPAPYPIKSINTIVYSDGSIKETEIDL